MYNNIQALRGIAAFLVVIFHLLPHYRAMGLSNVVFESIAQYGFAGVDVFFVISGFVMAKTTQNLPQNFSSSKHFISKRFLRIYLGYLPIFVFALIYYSTYSPEFVKNIDLLHSLLLTSIEPQKLLVGVSWTLSYELYFYLIIALLMAFRLPVLMTFAILSVVVIAKMFLSSSLEVTWLNFLLSHFLLDFFAGFFLFSLTKYYSQLRYTPIFILIAIVSLYFGVSIKIENNWTRIVTFGIFGFSLMWVLLALEVNNKLIIKGFLKKVGDASYSLYLVHIIFVNMFYTAGLRNALVTHHVAGVGFVAYTIMIVIISILIYRWIELPLYKKAINIIKKKNHNE